jgi:hypothetical protein
VRVDLNVGEIEQGLAMRYAQAQIEMFDDMLLFGEWAYLFKDDRLLVSIHASVLSGREDA